MPPNKPVEFTRRGNICSAHVPSGCSGALGRCFGFGEGGGAWGLRGAGKGAVNAGVARELDIPR